MITVTGDNNNLIYYTRYNRIDKYEIYDHSSNLLFSGDTSITGFNGKINHSGITYDFNTNNYFTYKSYTTLDSGVTYSIANHTLLQSVYTPKSNIFKEKTGRNSFKIKL